MYCVECSLSPNLQEVIKTSEKMFFCEKMGHHVNGKSMRQKIIKLRCPPVSNHKIGVLKHFFNFTLTLIIFENAMHKPRKYLFIMPFIKTQQFGDKCIIEVVATFMVNYLPIVWF